MRMFMIVVYRNEKGHTEFSFPFKNKILFEFVTEHFWLVVIKSVNSCTGSIGSESK